MRARQYGLSGNAQETESLLSSQIAYIPAGKLPEDVLSQTRVRVLERESLLVNSGELFSFNELFGVLQPKMQDPCRVCVRTIFAKAKKAIPLLRGNSESAFGFPIFLCLAAALYRAATTSTEKSQLPSRLSQWAGFLDKYPPPPNNVAWMLEDEDDKHLVSLFNDILEGIRTQNPAAFSSVAEYTGD